MTPRQVRAIECLAVTGSKTEAAEAAGVSRQTIYRWLGQPAFLDALRLAVAVALDELSLSLVGLGRTAVETLEGAMVAGDDETTWPVRVRAADLALSHLLAVREFASLEGRIAELERRIPGAER